jgi:hypothetical protein
MCKTLKNNPEKTRCCFVTKKRRPLIFCDKQTIGEASQGVSNQKQHAFAKKL